MCILPDGVGQMGQPLGMEFLFLFLIFCQFTAGCAVEVTLFIVDQII